MAKLITTGIQVIHAIRVACECNGKVALIWQDGPVQIVAHIEPDFTSATSQGKVCSSALYEVVSQACRLKAGAGVHTRGLWWWWWGLGGGGGGGGNRG